MSSKALVINDPTNTFAEALFDIIFSILYLVVDNMRDFYFFHVRRLLNVARAFTNSCYFVEYFFISVSEENSIFSENTVVKKEVRYQKC